MFELSQLFLAGVIYLLVLFFIAYATERNWIPATLARHPLVYTLSLGVYATSWSFYGSVGFAKDNGYNFLAIYVGVTLAFALSPVLLAPILRLTREYQLTSLADLLAFRYRSQAAGVFVTLFMLCGTMPYISLQIRAVTESIRILTTESTPQILALGFCVMLVLFAVLFGARHASPRDQHAGLVVAIAFESLVKLAALIAIGVFALYGVFHGPSGLSTWLAARPEVVESLYAPIDDGAWTTFLLLSFCAAFLLPRQFHMTFTEAGSERSLFTASWAFPAYLLALNLFIPVILWAGDWLGGLSDPDYYVLSITLPENSPLLTLIAFIGGVSAASAMAIVTTLALASMCLNHLLLPSIDIKPSKNLYRSLLWSRRALIAIIIGAGYGFNLVLEGNEGLVQLGLISFVAVAQFLPGALGVLYWPRGTRAGFLAGLSGGAAIWTLTLLLPLLEKSGWLQSAPNIRGWLGLQDADIWAFSTFSSLAINAGLFILVSMLTEQDAMEREAADSCRLTPGVLPAGVVLGAASPQEFAEQLGRILDPATAKQEVAQALSDLNMPSDEENPRELRRLRERIERNLSGLLGPMLSRFIVDERLQTDPDAQTALSDNIRFIESRLEQSQTQLNGLAAELDNLRRYHQQILKDLPLGVCSLGPDGTIVSWNLAMEDISGIPRKRAGGSSVGDVGRPWSELLTSCLEAEDRHQHKVQAEVAGHPRWFNLHKASIDDPGAPGGAGGVVILVEDLTDVQTLESGLAHNERLASIGRLAAGVAHEIGNPVTGIACLAQNLESETPDDEIKATCRQVIAQTQRISSIVHSLVSFSHSGTLIENAFEPIRLVDCITEAVQLVQLVQLSHEAGGIVCEVNCPAELWVPGDRPRLLQVFVNLLTNACDASSSDGKVTIEAANMGNNVEIAVADQGSGIALAVLDNLFEPFVTTKAPGKGTGLGLALTYSIVNDHQGRIRVDSHLDQGTVITVTLPAEANASTVDEQQAGTS